MSSGRIDAIASWYDLWLDAQGGFSTSPLSQQAAALPPGLRLTSCWEQAVFIPDVPISVTQGQTVRVTVECEDEKRLRWQLCVLEPGAAGLSVGTRGELAPTNELVSVAIERGAAGGGAHVSRGCSPRGPMAKHEAAEAARPEPGWVDQAVAPSQDDADIMGVECTQVGGQDSRPTGGHVTVVRSSMVVEVGERVISVINDRGRNQAYFGRNLPLRRACFQTRVWPIQYQYQDRRMTCRSNRSLCVCACPQFRSNRSSCVCVCVCVCWCV